MLDWIRDTIGVLPSSKSVCRSITYRQLGNDKFKTGDDAGAFELYSKSILFAPPNSPEIALAYANRSATEFHLEHFKVSCKHSSNIKEKRPELNKITM